MARTSKFRIELYAIGASRGIGDRKAIIDDAKHAGVSSYANDVGEAFFTLPVNHPLIAQVTPLTTHYVIKRQFSSGVYRFVGQGLIDDKDADRDEVTFYGTDYNGVLETSITASSTTYTNALLGTIVNTELTTAIGQTNSRLAFTAIGTIDATTITTTLITSFQSRLQFLSSVADVSMSSRSVRTLLTLTRGSPWHWSFTENFGADQPDVRVVWGGKADAFRYVPGFADFSTRIMGIGVKREGAAILYSEQTYASEVTYGRIARPQLFQNVIDQTALDRMTLRAARRAARADKSILLVLRSGYVNPYDGWDIFDSIPVAIARGSAVSVSGYQTIHGFEWVGSADGRESLFLDLQTKDT